MQAWKNKQCGKCAFKVDAPRQPGPVDLSAPKIIICRKAPPVVVYAIGQSRTNPQPVSMPLGSMYPMMEEAHPACSYFEEDKEIDFNNLNFDESVPEAS